MMRRRTVIQQAHGAQAQGVGAGHLYRLTNDQLVRVSTLESNHSAVGKDALKYIDKGEEAMSAAKNSTGLAVAAFVGAARAKLAYGPDLGFCIGCWVCCFFWCLVTAASAVGKLRTVRRKYADLHRRQNYVGVEATDMLRDMEADAARGVVGPDLRLRLTSLREVSFGRVGMQFLLHFYIAVIFVSGLVLSWMLIDVAYNNAIAQQRNTHH